MTLEFKNKVPTFRGFVVNYVSSNPGIIPSGAQSDGRAGVQEDDDQMQPKYDKYEDEKKTIRMFWDSPSVSGFSDSIKGT